MYVKNTPAGLLWRTLPAHVIYNAAAALHFARVGCFGAYARGKLAALAGLPRLLYKRAAIQSRRQVAASMLVAQMEKRWLAAKRREKRFDAALND
jgi:hypothetical protein